MEILEMTNGELFRNYACLLKEIANKNLAKKQFEDEIKNRFEKGELN